MSKFCLKLAAFVKGKERRFEDYIWSSFEPFTLGVWFLVFGAFIGQALYGTFIQYLEHRIHLVKNFNKFEHLWLYSRLLLLQGEEIIPFYTESGHFAFIVYILLLVTLFTNLYQGSLLSALLQSTNQNPFKSWDEMIALVKSEQYSFVAYQDQYENEW
uniref:Uncharacterized protein n=1 Tax=Panagrolaimus davidi TaxID=227884 RepID=A0A914PEM2_9BILA